MALDDTDRTIAARAHEVGWTKVGADLHAQGRAIAPGLSTDAEAGVIAGRYGVRVFPLQIAILLDQPGEDFEGGAFVITEKRARMQTRALVLPLEDGDAAIVAVNSRRWQACAATVRSGLTMPSASCARAGATP